VSLLGLFGVFLWVLCWAANDVTMHEWRRGVAEQATHPMQSLQPGLWPRLQTRTAPSSRGCTAGSRGSGSPPSIQDPISLARFPGFVDLLRRLRSLVVSGLVARGGWRTRALARCFLWLCAFSLQGGHDDEPAEVGKMRHGQRKPGLETEGEHFWAATTLYYSTLSLSVRLKIPRGCLISRMRVLRAPVLI